MIHKLEMLIALAKERHFGRAAESLGLTQPTLSNGIKQLEEQLGVKLVQRGSRFGGMTPEGLRALELARDIVRETRRLKDEMRSSHDGLSGQIRLAVIPTALTWASTLATSFNARHPNVSFSIMSRSSAEVLHMIEDLEADAGISYLDNEPLGRMSTCSLYRESYTLICHQTHALATRRSLPWRELRDLKLCLLSPEMQNRRIINRNFMEAGLTPVAMIESNSTVVLVSNVVSGDWVTILPTDMAGFLSAGQPLVSIPLIGGISDHAVGLLAAHQEPQTPVIAALFHVAQRISV
jgi:DNA-binding transcriptional LysR family regulator